MSFSFNIHLYICIVKAYVFSDIYISPVLYIFWVLFAYKFIKFKTSLISDRNLKPVQFLID